MYDYHIHSTYSDGAFLRWMMEAAATAGLDGVGFADHCSVLSADWAREYRREMGFSLDETYERRRQAIDRLRDDAEITVYDAVEMDYEPGHDAAIASFLDEAGFDYAIGSVHFLEGVNVHEREYFGEKSESERAELVDRYFDKLVSLIESELFAVAAHVDLIERNPALRGYADREQYERVAAAFTDSRTVPEINAGRVTDEYGTCHPSPAFLDVLHDHGVRFVPGTDSHAPDELTDRVEPLQETFAERGLEPMALSLPMEA